MHAEPTLAGSSAGALLLLVRRGLALDRSALAQRSGLGRSTVVTRVDALLRAGLLIDDTEGHAGTTLALNDRAGVLLTADLGATHARLSVADLSGDILAEQATELLIAIGPERVGARVRGIFGDLLSTVGHDPRDVWGLGIGVPGPVEHGSGRVVHPPIMPGWDGVAVPSLFVDDYPNASVLVDNEVNVMALGEYWSRWPEEDHLLFVKVGTGIGCGIVAEGRVHRGANGAAGDIGHIHVDVEPALLCNCGNLGCLEAHASGRAMARQLSERGIAASSSRDVVALVRGGEPAAARLVREGGRLIGEVLASAVNLLNPGVIVVGGDMATAEKVLLGGIREVVYRRSLPLATRQVRLVASDLGDRAGVIGAAAMTSEVILAPNAIDRRLAARAR